MSHTICTCGRKTEEVVISGERGGGKEEYQLVLWLDWDDVVAILSHVLAEFDVLARQAVLAGGVACVLVNQAPGGGLLPHHLFQHEADVIPQDAENAVQVHAVLQAVVEMAASRYVLTSA